MFGFLQYTQTSDFSFLDVNSFEGKGANGQHQFSRVMKDSFPGNIIAEVFKEN